MKKTIILGSVAFDAIETPFEKTDKIIGGAGTYICFAASYFSKPHALAVVGGDFPQEYISKLEQKGIVIDGIQIKKQEKTFFWSGKYFDNMNQRETLITELNVLEHFDPIVPDSYQNADYLMLGNLSPIVQRQVIERLTKRPKLIVMDTMNFWMDILFDELLQTIALVDVITINDEEARQLSGEYSIPKAAQKIMAMGPKYVIIKKGEHGAIVFYKNKTFYAPALPLETVIDPTGAGDTFAGGFIGYIAQQDKTDFETIKNAIVVGSALASFTVEQMGTQGIENRTQTEINERIAAFKTLTSYTL
ncbi:MAG: PfkB family carbohydrate kinase [Bacteroidales bacterium]|nr:PfkB family carbohydrate kinase [Bacteroidales bacterium]NLK81423.1 sugar kinase [Bacteroidales bacterium]HPY82203.1 PfkB family carbohydrate kinase [Bacteroidales bacterium]